MLATRPGKSMAISKRRRSLYRSASRSGVFFFSKAFCFVVPLLGTYVVKYHTHQEEYFVVFILFHFWF